MPRVRAGTNRSNELLTPCWIYHIQDFYTIYLQKSPCSSLNGIVHLSTHLALAAPPPTPPTHIIKRSKMQPKPYLQRHRTTSNKQKKENKGFRKCAETKNGVWSIVDSGRLAITKNAQFFQWAVAGQTMSTPGLEHRFETSKHHFGGWPLTLEMTPAFSTYLTFLRISAIGIWTCPGLSATSPFVPPGQVLGHDSWWLTKVPCSIFVMCLWHWVSISRSSTHFPFYSRKIQTNTAQFDKATNRTGTLGSAGKTALKQRCFNPLVFVFLIQCPSVSTIESTFQTRTNISAWYICIYI